MTADGNISARPFRFGVQASKATSRTAWVELARQCESLGYSTLTMPDHFDDQLAPVPALMCAADATSSLRVGALVWDNDYKHPVVLAKELSTIDVLSEGRLEIGLGAGWMISDYAKSGMAYDAAGVRVDRFVEGLHIIKQSMAGEAFSFSGQHYTITDFTGTPAAAQQPCPPVLIGGGGKRVLTIAAQQADIVGINPTMSAGVVGPEAFATMTAEAVDGKLDIARAAAAAAGRLGDIEWNIRAFMVNVSDDRSKSVRGIASALGVDASMVEHSPFALVGTPAQIADNLIARRERWGFSYVIVGADDVAPFAPVVAELAGR
jgi:probable F420-dependent oxidoreductase